MWKDIQQKISKIELTGEKLIIATVGAAVIIILGFYLFLCNPLVNKIKPARLECVSVENKLSELRAAINAAKTEEAREITASEEDVAFAIDELTRHGKSIGINFISMTPRQLEDRGGRHKVLPVEIEVGATYEELGAFFALLEELKESLITVSSFTIAADNKKPDNLKTKLVINIHIATL